MSTFYLSVPLGTIKYSSGEFIDLKSCVICDKSEAQGYHYEPNSRVGENFNTVAREIIKSEDGMTTLRAELNMTSDVVVKFSFGEAAVVRLITQAKSYLRLKDIQGCYIQILKGVFKGHIRAPLADNYEEREERVEFHCMILEYCRESLHRSEQFIQDLPKPEK